MRRLSLASVVSAAAACSGGADLAMTSFATGDGVVEESTSDEGKISASWHGSSADTGSSSTDTTSSGDASTSSSTTGTTSAASSDEGSTGALTSTSSVETGSTDGGGSTGSSGCVPGWLDCDARPGCETDIGGADPSHCGSCEKSCVLPGVVLDCAAGTCSGVVEIDVEDAHVDQLQPDTALGTNVALLVDASPVAYRTYVRPIDLAGIPAGATVDGATLRVRCFDSGDDVDAHVVTGDWDEASVTWTSKPTTEAAAFTSFAADAGNVAIDVTNVMQTWIDGDALLGIELRTSGDNGSDYRSSEYGAVAERPRFEITVSY